MPEIDNAGVRIHYLLSGNEGGDPLVLGNSLGSNLHMWDKVLPFFESKYRVIRFDTRGHGKSSVPPGPYRLEELGGDVLRLLDALNIEGVQFCGLSLGGQVAMWLGIYAPRRVSRLVLANTGARIGSLEMWDERIATVERSGLASVANTAPARWFTEAYREQHADELEEIRAMIAATDPAGYLGCCGVLRDSDLKSKLADISVPCLVIAGKYDPATTPSDGQAIHRALPNSKYVELESAHLSAWERAAEFAAEVVGFLDAAEAGNG